MGTVRIERGKTQGVFVGPDVRVAVGEIKGDVVELFVSAPAALAITRDDDGIGLHMIRQRKLDLERAPAEAPDDVSQG